jgi:ribulose kinase
MLLGTAMAAAAAAGLYPDLPAAAIAMRQGEVEHQGDQATFARFDRDYRIFQEMQRHRKALDTIT